MGAGRIAGGDETAVSRSAKVSKSRVRPKYASDFVVSGSGKTKARYAMQPSMVSCGLVLQIWTRDIVDQHRIKRVEGRPDSATRNG